jgi:hypothetical protein
MAKRSAAFGSSATRRWGAGLLVLGLACPVAADDAAPAATTLSPILAAGAWAVAQLIPSPALVIGENHVGGGLRWQLTPLLFSFGIAARPLRSFVVSPIARHSGSVELHVSPEWACCAASSDHSWLARAGLRVYLPWLEHGEVLSWSIGASGYYAADGIGPAGDLGIYTLFGVIGLTVTISPLLFQREVITALNIRYF